MVGKAVGKRVARAKAKEVFQQYKANGGTIPVRIGDILDLYDIDLVEDKMESDLAGMLLVDDHSSIIVVNSHHHELRQRFTLAHELGHFLLHRRSGDAIFHRDEKSAQGTNRAEMDANAFAAELLMPSEEVRKRASELNVDILFNNPVSDLAREFEVSSQAMGIRLQQLGFIDLEAYW